MGTRNSEAVWEGTLKDGKGMIKLGSGAYEGAYSFESRFEAGKGTNPEELIAAAHAGCFSMALAYALEEKGYSPESIRTVANVHIDKVDDAFKITLIELQTQAKVPDIDEEEFQSQAEAVKMGCPVSQALAGTEIELKSRLLS